MLPVCRPFCRFKDMAGAVLGMWSAHGEGRFTFDQASEHLVPVQYVNDDAQPTEEYPFNPNGPASRVIKTGCARGADRQTVCQTERHRQTELSICSHVVSLQTHSSRRLPRRLDTRVPGSPNGAAACTSPDGRHLAIMPHPQLPQPTPF